MPINNDLFGVFKSFKLGDNIVVASSVSRNRTMSANPVNYVQGTPKARVMDIGGVTETFNVNAPLFVGFGSSVDGRYIANAKIDEILNPETAQLPILNSATFSIGAEQSNVSLQLESDGDPNNTTAFQILNTEVEQLKPSNGPTRLAKFYDFRVQIGSRKYFIISATLNVNAQTDKKYFFIPGDVYDFRGWGVWETYANAGNANTTGGSGLGATTVEITLGTGAFNPATGTGATTISFQPGTQFPFMGVSTLQITGSGQAAVLLKNTDGGIGFTGENESLNLNLQPGTTDLDLQDPGIVRYKPAGFRIEIFDPVWYAAQEVSAPGAAGNGWTSFLTPNLSLQEAIVNTSNFSLTSGLLTVDFNFVCWVR